MEIDSGPEVLQNEYEDSSQSEATVDTDAPLLQLYTFFLFMFQTLFRLSDTALNVLISFFAMFLKTLSQSFMAIPQSFLAKLPLNLRAARSIAGNTKSQFQRFVCCPSCRSIYPWQECIIKLPDGSLESKRCSFIRFPNHPQIQHRKSCDVVLMKKVKSASGNVVLYPKQIYTYKSIIESLKELLARPDFSMKCEAWRNLPCRDEYFNDVFDGQVWKDFQIPDGVPFLCIPNNFAFQINVDWFNPFTHTQHSEGAIYMSVMNLPRQDRFLQENVMLVGVIPGPKEPPLHINSFLKPLVDELKELWRGVPLTNAKGQTIFVRAALLCAGCDIPATRKVGGFVGHRATKGCSKCCLSFPTESFGEKPDYSNYSRDLWEKRSNDKHREMARKYQESNTQADQRKIEREHGIRYTVLLELPYFDASRMCTIDPMHNLLLGTAKHVMETWKRLSVIDSKNYDVIQKKVDSFISPPDIGRVPFKIASGFAGFTAEQWKNWTLFFSLFALKDVIPRPHYNCWHLFVKACYCLCRRSLSSSQVSEGDTYLMEFCRSFAELYGSEHCTLNMHLHGHLAECIRDYGPVYSFWCFAFERMNGILGSYHVNNHHISIQLTRRFLDSKMYAPINWPNQYAEEYLPLLHHFRYHKGSLQQETIETQLSTTTHFTALPPVKEYALLPEELEALYQLFDHVYEKNSYQILILCHQSKALLTKDFIIGAQKSRHSQSSLVLAKKTNSDNACLAEIIFFLECVVLSRSSNGHTRQWVAAVNWFMDHPCQVWYGNPTQVWSTARYPGIFYILVSDIVSRVVYTQYWCDFGRFIGTDKVYVVVPLASH